MSDVFSQRSAAGDIIAMLRRADRPDGSQSIEISDGSPDTSGIVMSREDARALGEALISASYTAEMGGEAAEWGPLAHLHPEVVNRRIAAAMTRGL